MWRYVVRKESGKSGLRVGPDAGDNDDDDDDDDEERGPDPGEGPAEPEYGFPSSGSPLDIPPIPPPAVR